MPWTLLGLGVLLLQPGGYRLLGKVSTWILPEVSPGLLMESRNTASPPGKTWARKSWHSLKEFIVVAWPILIVAAWS